MNDKKILVAGCLLISGVSHGAVDPGSVVGAESVVASEYASADFKVIDEQALIRLIESGALWVDQRSGSVRIEKSFLQRLDEKGVLLHTGFDTSADTGGWKTTK